MGDIQPNVVLNISASTFLETASPRRWEKRQNFNRKTKEKDHLKDLSVDGRIWFRKLLKRTDCFKWIRCNTQTTLQSRAFVNKGTNFRVPHKAGVLLTGLKTGRLSKRILSMELIKVSCGIKGYLHYRLRTYCRLCSVHKKYTRNITTNICPMSD